MDGDPMFSSIFIVIGLFTFYFIVMDLLLWIYCYGFIVIDLLLFVISFFLLGGEPTKKHERKDETEENIYTEKRNETNETEDIAENIERERIQTEDERKIQNQSLRSCVDGDPMCLRSLNIYTICISLSIYKLLYNTISLNILLIYIYIYI